MSEAKTDRRTFIKAPSGAAAAVALAGTVAPAQQQEKAAVSDHKPLSKVNCFSEDGELKEVIYGRLDNMVIPKYDPMWDFAGPDLTSLMKKAGGKLFSEADPEWFKQANDSLEAGVQYLKDMGIVVHRPRDLTDDEKANFRLSSAFHCDGYNRDSLVSIGNTLVETAFKTPERMRNKYPVRYISMALMKAGNRVISIPQPLDTYKHNEEESPLIEGGDVEIDHGHIYIGNSGQASNSLGVLWMKNAFPDWQVHEIKISSKTFPHQHLDCALVMFKEWGVVLIDDIVGGYKGLPEPLQKKQWIEQTEKESHLKWGNFIALNEEEIIMATEAERLRKEIEDKIRPRIKVHHIPYLHVGRIGGSFRCNTCPIYREG